LTEIVEVEPSTAPNGLLEQLYVVDDEAGRELLGGAPPPSLTERVARYRNPGPYRRRRWLARVESEPAGIGAFDVFGPAFCTGDIRVRPAFRRRGVGRALFEVVCAAARDQGAATFFGHHGTAAGAAFAAAIGARDDQRDVKSVLRLPEAQLPEPGVMAGIELRSWVGAVPAELLGTFVTARNWMNDAPAPGGAADIPWSVQRQQEDDASLVARGTPSHTTVVLDAGEVVALTAIRVSAPPCPYVTTDDTCVIPSHRGRGLAYAVKLCNLRWLREKRPDIELVGTMNAEENGAMRAVNTKLGFVPTITLTSAVVTIPAG
jgi:GNAT superfamily N-acetyltransferase